MAKDLIKKRYRTKAYTALGEYGTFNRGELIDSDINKIPQKVLDDLEKQGTLEYVDTVKWDAAAHNGEGAWVAQSEPEPAPESEPAPEPAKKPAGRETPSGPKELE